MVNMKRIVFIVGCAFALTACEMPDREVKESQHYEGLDSQAYNALSDENKYKVANKLTAALYKGVPVDEFFDVTKGTDKLKLLPRKGGKNYLQEVQDQLNTPLSEVDPGYLKSLAENSLADKYRFDGNEMPLQVPMAVLYDYPMSKEFFTHWMAYRLMQTIMFSPAEEIDSASSEEVNFIYNNLVEAIGEGVPVRQIIYRHMVSQANWRRFRSPEDNTREMIEIYLGLFDRDEDVPRASIACKNWSLSDEDEGYQLRKDYSKINLEPQDVLGYVVTTCEDFFRVIAEHPLVIPRVTTVLVDHFFNVSYDPIKRAKLVNKIIEKNPTTFSEIFTAILFSKEHLLDMERPKFYEETFLHQAARIRWKPSQDFFRQVNGTGEQAVPTLLQMNQAAFRLKLGRWADPAKDSLSFAYYHKSVRENLFLTTGNTTGWNDSSLFGNARLLSTKEFINYLFLATLSRKPTSYEMETLEPLASSSQHNTALLVLDYIARLPELYYFEEVSR